MKVSVVIPTYRRERVLLDTVRFLHRLEPPASEILVVDQTGTHLPETAGVLVELRQRTADAGGRRLPESRGSEAPAGADRQRLGEMMLRSGASDAR